MEPVLLRESAGNVFVFWCPGCKCCHTVDEKWKIDDPNTNKPTIRPSVL